MYLKFSKKSLISFFYYDKIQLSYNVLKITNLSKYFKNFTHVVEKTNIKVVKFEFWLEVEIVNFAFKN